MIDTGSDFSGVGAFEQALDILGIKANKKFVCDADYFARLTFIHNYGTKEDQVLANSKEHKTHYLNVQKIFSGKHNFSTQEIESKLDQADEFAKRFSFYFPFNVYDRSAPYDSLDIYMTSPPCQAFSIAGHRLGKEDPRGVLFFNSLEFIETNKPRVFIFENVKGLLSHNKINKKDKYGETFKEWIDYLGCLSVNGVPTENPIEGAVPYHIHFKVLNSKKHGTPQNRERVFIVGFRDEADNVFEWPREQHLDKRLKDVLENEVDEKYFLSDKMVSQLVENTNHLIPGDYSKTIRVGGGGSLSEKHAFDMIKVVGNTTPSGNGMNGNVFDENGIAPTLSTNKGEGIKIKSATKSGFEIATENDSINYSVPNSETRRGRVGVGVGVAQTLDTGCNQAVIVGTWRTHKDGNGFREIKDGNCPTIPARARARARAREDGSGQPVVCVPVLTPDRLEKRQNGRRFKEDGDEMFTITTQDRHGVFDGYRIRRLTPRECFRLMSFPDSFTWPVSDSQAYKQAGNSIDASLLAQIIAETTIYKNEILNGI